MLKISIKIHRNDNKKLGTPLGYTRFKSIYLNQFINFEDDFYYIYLKPHW